MLSLIKLYLFYDCVSLCAHHYDLIVDERSVHEYVLSTGPDKNREARVGSVLAYVIQIIKIDISYFIQQENGLVGIYIIREVQLDYWARL